MRGRRKVCSGKGSRMSKKRNSKDHLLSGMKIESLWLREAHKTGKLGESLIVRVRMSDLRF